MSSSTITTTTTEAAATPAAEAVEEGPRQLAPWEISLAAFKPTNKIYSSQPGIVNNISCHVCEDFSEVDEFAAMCTLDKLNVLRTPARNDMKKPPGPEDKVFDARLLMQMLSSMINNNSSTANATLEQIFKALDLDKDLVAGVSQASVDINKKKQAAIAAGKPAEEIDAIQVQMDKLTRDFTSDGRYIGPLRGQIVHEEIARCLWSNFSRCRETTLGDRYERAQRDNVVKARLIFTWVALSIKYDDALTKVPIGQRGTDNVRTANFLIKRTEVCQLYARAFQWMFNAVAAQPDGGEPPSQATYITGLSRNSCGGIQKDKFPIDKGSHAWASFPLHPAAVVDSDEYQLIDPTWATATSLKELDTLWWSMPNAAFKWSHLRTDDQSTENRGVWSVWFNAPQTNIAEDGRRYLQYINHATINQQGLVARAENGSITVSFQNACKHQSGKTAMSGFYLGATGRGIASSVFDLEPSFAPAKYTSFNYGVAGGVGTWTAALDVNRIAEDRVWIAILACVDDETGTLGILDERSWAKGTEKYVPVVYWSFDKA